MQCSATEAVILHMHCYLQQAAYAALQLETAASAVTATAAATAASGAVTATTSSSCCPAAAPIADHNVIETDISKQSDAPNDDVATDVTLQQRCASELLVKSVPQQCTVLSMQHDDATATADSTDAHVVQLTVKVAVETAVVAETAVLSSIRTASSSIDSSSSSSSGRQTSDTSTGVSNDVRSSEP
jgi:hypothetical protein